MPEQPWLKSNPGEERPCSARAVVSLPASQTEDPMKPCQCKRCSDIIQKNADRWLTRN